MQTIIPTTQGNFRRTAWMGGNTPPPEFALMETGRQLIAFFMEDQIADCGGEENIKNWCFFGTVEDKLNIFRNRALLDAWATFNQPATSPFEDSPEYHASFA